MKSEYHYLDKMFLKDLNKDCFETQEQLFERFKERMWKDFKAKMWTYEEDLKRYRTK